MPCGTRSHNLGYHPPRDGRGVQRGARSADGCRLPPEQLRLLPLELDQRHGRWGAIGRRGARRLVLQQRYVAWVAFGAAVARIGLLRRRQRRGDGGVGGDAPAATVTSSPAGCASGHRGCGPWSIRHPLLRSGAAGCKRISHTSMRAIYLEGTYREGTAQCRRPRGATASDDDARPA